MHPRRDPVTPILLAAVWTFAAAVPTLLLSRLELPVASIWLANITAILLILKHSSSPRWSLHLGAAIGIFAANLAGGNDAALSAGFTAANLVEIYVSSTLLLKRLGGFPKTPEELLSSLSISMTAGPLLSAFAGGAVLSVALGVPFGSGAIGWLGSSVVSALVVVSATWALSAIDVDAEIGLWKKAALWSALVLSTVTVFGNTSYPLLFLPPVLLVLLGLLGQPRQAVLGMLAVATYAVIATHLGSGPVALVADTEALGHGQVLQIYLLSLGLFTVPAALNHIRMTEALRSVEASKEAATAASEAKSNFVATMSHELRTPLAGISGYIEFLRDTPLSSSQGRYLARLESGVQQLHTVIGDILDMSRIEAGELELQHQTVQLAELAEACVSLVAGQVTDDVSVRAVIEADVPPFVSTDEGRLQQVLLNLLNNAAKFTDIGNIALRIQADAERPGWVEFRVQDTGCGIPQENIQKVLARFQQVDSRRDRAYGGSGLGLTIAQQIVEAMGGQLSLSSQLGLGTTVTFRIPLEAVATPENSAQAGRFTRRTPTLSPLELHVLLVDDDAVMGELMKMQLQVLGCQVTLCEDPLVAAGLAVDGRFDILLSDLHMPGLDGFGLLQRVRRVNPGLPAMLMTADATVQARQIALTSGFKRVLIKPVSRVELHSALSDAEVFEALGPGGLTEGLIDTDSLAELNLVLGADKMRGSLQSAIRSFEALADELAHPSISKARLMAIAHQLKGAAGSFSLPGIRGQAALLEEALRAEADPGVNIEALIRAIHATREELGALGLLSLTTRPSERRVIPFVRK
ncbi:MAG: response regulator [Alphaproteobacteria bacterium]|nr:response regulator [Alphaproteobacteria bacterium]MCB9791488.1 response regulator [Alphaproteobacteria bacterium]